MNKGDKVRVILLNDGNYSNLGNVKFPTEPIDGIYFDESVIDIHGSVLRSLPFSNWFNSLDSDYLGTGFGFYIGKEAIIVNSEE